MVFLVFMVYSMILYLLICLKRSRICYFLFMSMKRGCSMLKGSFFFSCLKFLSNEGVNFLNDYNFNFNYYEVIFNSYLYLFLI